MIARRVVDFDSFLCQGFEHVHKYLRIAPLKHDLIRYFFVPISEHIKHLLKHTIKICIRIPVSRFCLYYFGQAFCSRGRHHRNDFSDKLKLFLDGESKLIDASKIRNG